MKFAYKSTHRNNVIALALFLVSSLCLGIAASRSRPDAAPIQNDSAPGPVAHASQATEQAREAYGKIEMSFEANRGQTDASVNYLARGSGYTLFLKPTEAVFQLPNADSGLRNGDEQTAISNQQSAIEESAIPNDQSQTQHSALSTQKDSHSKVLRLKLVGADEDAAVEGADKLAGKVNYFKGNDPSRWRADVPTYAKVRYTEVYPGIDLVYYGTQRQLEYDFVVAPGEDPHAIRLDFAGADKIEVNGEGELLLTLGASPESVVRQPKPLIYQQVAGERRIVAGGYALGADKSVGFELGDYDPSLPLVIDPTLVYSTYLGGSDTDESVGIAVDSAGNAYICGVTNSTNFPTANAIQGTFSPPIDPNLVSRDGFVTKLNAAGTALVYSTYLGGNADDFCHGIAVDASGNAYVAGETGSTNFPTANAIQSTYGGGFKDAFITKINPAGSALVYSTFLGGTIFDAAQAITIDSTNNVYITGRSTSTNYPVVNPIQAAFTGGPGADVIITKINAAGNALVYSTYLGGSTGASGGFENGSSIAVDSAGNAYVTGQTRSTDFPTANAIQSTFGGGSPDGDAFVTKINAAGSALVYSTYLGGSDNDVGFEIAVDSVGNAHVAGVARSTNFPTANAFQSTLKGASDGFLTKLNAAGNAFVYSTYLGGTADDSANAITLDNAGIVYLAGGTSSTDFPLVNPTQATFGGTFDNFVTKFNAAGSALTYSTYFGGSGGDTVISIAVDSAKSMFLTGRTSSTNYPTLNPVQSTNGGGTTDAFVTKISDPPPVVSTFQFNQAAYPVTEEVTSVTVTVTRLGDSSAAATVDYATADGTATERADYTTALGTLRFAVGETSKTFDVLVNEDSKVEALENFSVALSNPTGGASLGTQATTTIQITDDLAEPSTNVIDDSTIFVGTHYHDFLNRQADSGGLAFWTNQITACGSDVACIDRTRTSVSTAFFVSIEFQRTGFEVIRIYRASFIDTPARPRALPRYREFLRDTQEVQRGVIVGVGNWEQQLNDNRINFARAWVQRADFIAEFPLGMPASDYVNRLFTRSGVTPTAAEFNSAVNAYNAGDVEGRAQALLAVIGSGSVFNAQFNPAFVLMQYIGYLRRNPNDAPEAGLDYAGFDYWLTKMDQFSIAGEDVRNEQVALARIQRGEMVRAFILSLEYRGRFGP